MIKLLLTFGLIGLTACTTTQTAPPGVNNKDIVKQIYADFANGNMDGFTAALAPDIVWNEADHNPYSPDSPYLGVEAVMSGVFAPLGKDWTSFHVVPETYIADGNTVAMFGRYDATYKPTGKTMNPQVVHVWTLKDGKMTAFQQYADTYAMHDVISLGGADYAKKIEKEALQNYVTAINSNDLDTFMSMVTDDVIFQIPHGPEIVGADAVREWAGGYYAAYRTNYKKTPLDFALNGDIAVERYSYIGIDTDRKTGVITRDKGKGLIMYRRGADGKWRVARDAWSTDSPMPY